MEKGNGRTDIIASVILTVDGCGDIVNEGYLCATFI